MSKRGPTPSLIGSNAGAVRIVEALGTRKCKRCDGAISRNLSCIEVAKPGTMGHRTYCTNCFAEVLEKTRNDVESLREQIAGL